MTNKKKVQEEIEKDKIKLQNKTLLPKIKKEVNKKINNKKTD